MKAYIASVEIEIPIYAENEFEAAKVAKKYFNDEIYSNPPSEMDFSIQLMKKVPDRLESDTYCWSENDDEITIADGIELNRSTAS